MIRMFIMNSKVENRVKNRKLGAEDILMIRVPSERFRMHIPENFYPLTDGKSRYRIAMIAQSCSNNSFDGEEAGPTDDFHFWLQVESSNSLKSAQGGNNLMPEMKWIAVSSATSNAEAYDHLKTFGFSPLALEKSSLKESGGSLAFSDGGSIDWSITGGGRKREGIEVYHTLLIPLAAKLIVHRISALLSDAVIGQLGKVKINTSGLKPYLRKGERFAASINRVTALEADAVWNTFN